MVSGLRFQIQPLRKGTGGGPASGPLGKLEYSVGKDDEADWLEVPQLTGYGLLRYVCVVRCLG